MNFLLINFEMEMYSLEDDGNGLFLTQRDPIESGNSQSAGILGDGSDFVSPCASLDSVKQDQYSDISDDECDFQSSQKGTSGR